MADKSIFRNYKKAYTRGKILTKTYHNFHQYSCFVHFNTQQTLLSPITSYVGPFWSYFHNIYCLKKAFCKWLSFPKETKTELFISVWLRHKGSRTKHRSTFNAHNKNTVSEEKYNQIVEVFHENLVSNELMTLKPLGSVCCDGGLNEKLALRNVAFEIRNDGAPHSL